jgi:hypothetical protein
MLTIFTAPKPFRGPSAFIQRNALKSWTLLQPMVEVMLLGSDRGSAEVYAGFGSQYESHLGRHKSGMEYINYIFARG